MGDVEEIIESELLPQRLRRILSLMLTVMAVLIYALVMGIAIYRTLTEPDPVFTDAWTRVVAGLSGLVGAVVTAGFSRGSQSSTSVVALKDPAKHKSLSVGWHALRSPSRARCKMLGLASFLGARVALPVAVVGALDDEEVVEPDDDTSSTSAVWLAVLYFCVYFITGAASLLTVLLTDNAPAFLSDAAWVWLGTVASSAYSYFSIDSSFQVTIASRNW